MIQSCSADFKIDKDEEDIWGVYQVTVHARIFENREATEYIALDTTSFEIDLVKPTFEEIDYSDEDFNWEDEDSIDKIWNQVDYVMGEGSIVETDLITNTDTTHAYSTDLFIDFVTNLDQSRPDELMFYFHNSLSNYNTDADDTIINVVTFGTDMTIQCINRIGDEDGDESMVKTFEGAGYST